MILFHQSPYPLPFLKMRLLNFEAKTSPNLMDIFLNFYSSIIQTRTTKHDLEKKGKIELRNIDRYILAKLREKDIKLNGRGIVAFNGSNMILVVQCS